MVVAAPLASACHARFPAFELFVPFFHYAVVLLKVVVSMLLLRAVAVLFVADALVLFVGRCCRIDYFLLVGVLYFAVEVAQRSMLGRH